MEMIKIIGHYVEPLWGINERCEEKGYLISENIAVTQDIGTIYFLRVSPSEEESGAYDDNGILCDICVLNNHDFDIANLPVEALTFALWASKSAEPIALAV